jgi:hypothetical protein
MVLLVRTAASTLACVATVTRESPRVANGAAGVADWGGEVLREEVAGQGLTNAPTTLPWMVRRIRMKQACFPPARQQA